MIASKLPADKVAAARKRKAQKAKKAKRKLRPTTVALAGWLVLITTLDASWPAPEVLRLYQARWQIELVFKRLKTLAELGSLPKHDEQSARAWLYGKLLIALLGQKLERLGRDISPWGYRLPEMWKWQRVAGF